MIERETGLLCIPLVPECKSQQSDSFFLTCQRKGTRIYLNITCYLHTSRVKIYEPMPKYIAFEDPRLRGGKVVLQKPKIKIPIISISIRLRHFRNSVRIGNFINYVGCFIHTANEFSRCMNERIS